MKIIQAAKNFAQLPLLARGGKTPSKYWNLRVLVRNVTENIYVVFEFESDIALSTRFCTILLDRRRIRKLSMRPEYAGFLNLEL